MRLSKTLCMALLVGSTLLAPNALWPWVVLVERK
ncbi:hypothetical protein cje154_09596 [Campylobacter jejuni subsp. jejuni 2008-988]|uniref:Uncharacterized protein n=1 Tax=Campylobacter jejuni subsp. jejuni 2008-988 TaxID=889253 RepID=A0ABC9QJH4_CAMJU|nr:hypothetical protein cje154_09596 [Campylobacter jejuni subsp. jejuni 2008-988]EIB83357.1 hypothetical protein cje79_07187 [Campylobacter jejuni subsp. jejuni 1893]